LINQGTLPPSAHYTFPPLPGKEKKRKEKRNAAFTTPTLKAQKTKKMKDPTIEIIGPLLFDS